VGVVGEGRGASVFQAGNSEMGLFLRGAKIGIVAPVGALWGRDGIGPSKNAEKRHFSGSSYTGGFFRRENASSRGSILQKTGAQGFGATHRILFPSRLRPRPIRVLRVTEWGGEIPSRGHGGGFPHPGKKMWLWKGGNLSAENACKRPKKNENKPIKGKKIRSGGWKNHILWNKKEWGGRVKGRLKRNRFRREGQAFRTCSARVFRGKKPQLHVLGKKNTGGAVFGGRSGRGPAQELPTRGQKRGGHGRSGGRRGGTDREFHFWQGGGGGKKKLKDR